jgi:hypothetical protein
VAQTRRKRKRRHAGTQAGTVERRGRTSKPAEKTKAETRAEARERRLQRLDQPPTWRSAATRAAVAAVIFGLVIVLAFGRSPIEGASLAGLMFLIYIPMSYMTDRFLFARRQRQKAAAQGDRRPARKAG